MCVCGGADDLDLQAVSSKQHGLKSAKMSAYIAHFEISLDLFTSGLLISRT